MGCRQTVYLDLPGGRCVSDLGKGEAYHALPPEVQSEIDAKRARREWQRMTRERDDG